VAYTAQKIEKRNVFKIPVGKLEKQGTLWKPSVYRKITWKCLREAGREDRCGLD